MVNPEIEGVTGRLDRIISELLEISKDPNLDSADCQTLKHHSDDMKAAAQLMWLRSHARLLKLQEMRTK